MAIAYVTGAKTDNGLSNSTSLTITIPAGVAAGDTVLVGVAAVPATGTTSPTLAATSTGTTPIAETAVTSPDNDTALSARVWWFTAASSDAGKVITITASLSSYMAISLAAYSGCNSTTPIDVIQGTSGGASTGTVTCPSLATGTAGDWAVYLCAGASEAGSTPSVPSGSTSRTATVDFSSSSDMTTQFADSNAAVGGAGTSIGGGTFSCTTVTDTALAAWTIGLTPAAAPAETVTVTNPGNQTSQTAASVSLQISATDSASLSLTYTASGLPGGLSISSSGLISGTITASPGTFSVTVTATSTSSTTGTASFTWTVQSGAGSIAYVASSSADSGLTEVTSLALTLPSAAASGDVVLVTAVSVPSPATGVPALSATSTATAPVQIGSTVTGTETDADMAVAVWKIVAGASDAGATVTITSTQSAYMQASCVVYSGVSTANPVDVINGAFGGANTASVTCPALSTTAAGDWAVYIGAGAPQGGSMSAVPAGSTTRISSFSTAFAGACITDTAASVGPAGTSIGGGTFSTTVAQDSLLAAFTIGLEESGSSSPPVLSAVHSSTAGDGTQTWTVTSRYNGPSTSVLRILPPAKPNTSYPHSFIYALPVEIGQSTEYGDPISVLGDDLAAHNTYNTTIVVPSFPIEPWYADNPANVQQNQESFMLALASWMATSTFAGGGEKHYLIGFSKSGIGGQGLQFHRPDIWAKTASWDAPFAMTSYDGDDVYSGPVGGDPTDCYGSNANFTANYELSTSNITTWTAGHNFTTMRRLWIGGWHDFQQDNNAYMTELTGLGILYDGSWNTEDTSHAWHDDWVAAALASMFGSASSSGSGLLMAAGIV